jgi:hypothetical protein
MIAGHYILWRLASNTGPVALLYVLGIAVVMVVTIELVDRVTKRFRKKPNKKS